MLSKQWCNSSLHLKQDLTLYSFTCYHANKKCNYGLFFCNKLHFKLQNVIYENIPSAKTLACLQDSKIFKNSSWKSSSGKRHTTLNTNTYKKSSLKPSSAKYTLGSKSVHYVWCPPKSILYGCSKVESGDRANFSKVVEAIKTNFNERYEELRNNWSNQGLCNDRAEQNKMKF